MSANSIEGSSEDTQVLQSSSAVLYSLGNPQQTIQVGQGEILVVSSNTRIPQQNVFSVEAGGTKDQPVLVVTRFGIGEPPKDDADKDNNDNVVAAAVNTAEKVRDRHPCSFIGLSREQGARIWAIFNLVVAVIDFIITLYHLLYVTHSEEMSEGYMEYFRLFHAMECPYAVQVDVILTFVGSLLNTLSAVMLICGTHLKNLEKNTQISLSVWYIHLVLLPLLFALPRMVIALYARTKDHEKGGPCFIEENVNLESKFWVLNVLQLVTMIVWHAYGFMVAISFVRWLKKLRKEAKKIEETKVEVGNESLEEVVLDEEPIISESEV